MPRASQIWLSAKWLHHLTVSAQPCKPRKVNRFGRSPATAAARHARPRALPPPLRPSLASATARPARPIPPRPPARAGGGRRPAPAPPRTAADVSPPHANDAVIRPAPASRGARRSGALSSPPSSSTSSARRAPSQYSSSLLLFP